MAAIFAHLLLLLAFQFALFEAAVLHPKLRRRRTSASASVSVEENDIDNEDGQKQHSTPKTDAKQNDGAIGQFFDHLKTFFTAASKNLAHPPSEAQQRLNNCFFTPMNCQIAGSGSIGMAKRGGQRVAAVFVISDEEREKLMERQRQKQNQHKMRPKRKGKEENEEEEQKAKDGKKKAGRRRRIWL